MSVTVGMKAKAEAVVNDQNTAISAGSGTLPVFATPWMCALMEQAAWTAVAPGLAEGESTVGTKLNISHVSATAVDGKRLEFKVAAYDEKGLIGEGTHERFIITDERFLGKAARKLEQ